MVDTTKRLFFRIKKEYDQNQQRIAINPDGSILTVLYNDKSGLNMIASTNISMMVYLDSTNTEAISEEEFVEYLTKVRGEQLLLMPEYEAAL